MQDVHICETFTSIQGESTYAGLPCFFIRLAGCNLNCSYCDTPQAVGPGVRTPVSVSVADALASRAPLVEITGGEPLLQDGFAELAHELNALQGKTVLVETNGSRDISAIPEGVIAIMDVKCPGSGEEGTTDRANFGRLRLYDEIKFVVGSLADCEWAARVVVDNNLSQRCHAVCFSPVTGRLDATVLADWIISSGLPVRLGLQLHKALGVR